MFMNVSYLEHHYKNIHPYKIYTRKSGGSVNFEAKNES